MENTKTYEEFLEEFKIMLVKRYFWTVTDASKYENEELNKCYEEGLNRYQSYFRIFNVDQDLMSPL